MKFVRVSYANVDERDRCTSRGIPLTVRCEKKQGPYNTTRCSMALSFLKQGHRLEKQTAPRKTICSHKLSTYCSTSYTVRTYLVYARYIHFVATSCKIVLGWHPGDICIAILAFSTGTRTSTKFETCIDDAMIDFQHKSPTRDTRTTVVYMFTYLSLRRNRSFISDCPPNEIRNPSSRLNKEIEDEVKAFTARSTGQPTDQDFLELENNVRELRVKYCKSGGSVTSRQDGDGRGASSSGQREATPGSSRKVRGLENRNSERSHLGYWCCMVVPFWPFLVFYCVSLSFSRFPSLRASIRVVS